MIDELWNIFFATGRVSDYLVYKKYEEVAEFADNDEGACPSGEDLGRE